MEEDKKKRSICTKSYHHSNHGKQQMRIIGYNKEYTNYNPETTLKYSVANIVANGWINIEDDEHLIYWVKGKSSLYEQVFTNKVHNWFILYSEGQKRNSSNRISKLKEPWTGLNLKEIQSIFHPN